MNDHIMGVVLHCRLSSLSEDHPVAVFFDFRAAFLSVDQTFMKAVLESLGLPAWITRLVSALYRGNRCQIVMAGQYPRHGGHGYRQTVVATHGVHGQGHNR